MHGARALGHQDQEEVIQIRNAETKEAVLQTLLLVNAVPTPARHRPV